MKNAFAIVTLSALLSACAGMQSGSQHPSDSAVSKAGSETESHAAALDPLPQLELSSEITFLVLSSEIAFQRGEWESAYITLLGLAQKTRDSRLAHRAAEIAIAAKRGSEALAAVRLWRELAPHSDEATQYFLGFIVLSDNPSEAEPILAQRLSSTAPNARALTIFQTQRVLARAKEKAIAFAMLERLLAPYKDMLEAHVALAQGAFAKGDNVRATEEGKLALAIKPDSELALLSLAQATPNPDAALEILNTFLTAYPKAREVRTAYGRMLVDLKQYDLAGKQFQIVLKNTPEDLTSLYALGVISIQTDQPKVAEGYFANYISILEANPNDERDGTKVIVLLAQLAEERGDSETAAKWLAKLDGSEAENAAYFDAQLKRAHVIAKRGELATARKLLHELMPAEKADQVQVIQVEATLLRDANKVEDSLEILGAGLKKFPTDTDLLYDYAMMAEKLDRLFLMETTLRKLITLAPDNHQAYNALGYSLADRNLRLDEARELIVKALSLAPEDAFILDSMGWVEFRLGKLDEAEGFLRRAFAQRQDAEIAVHLGEVLWNKGERSAAQKLWREAQTKDPKNDALKSTLTRLNATL
ncbi:MAG: tetratricopeptide repeat protein [Pseudomonadota bacterium]